MQEIPVWRRVVRAAGRLAALYVGAVVILLFVAVSLMEGVLPTFAELFSLWTPFAVAFLIAFALLAIARRAGLVALWVLLLGIWILMVLDTPFPWIGKQFVAWTVLALPLYCMGIVGAPSTHPVAR